MKIPIAHMGEEKRANPSWQDVELFIRRLDGQRNTDVFIGDSASAHYMVISGGMNGKYIGVVQDGENGFYSLSSREQNDTLSLAKIGGLDDYRKTDRFQSLETVLAAAKTYFDLQVMDSRFVWVKGE